MSIIDTLITDRSTSDVLRVKQLSERISNHTATAAEVTEYLTDSKGSYNASDLNRVGLACEYLYGLITGMGYFVDGYTSPKTDWVIADIPSDAQMQAYIGNVAALKAMWNAAQSVPASMVGINQEDANNIEKLLIEVDDQIRRIQAIFIKSGAWNAFSGTGFYIKEGE